MIEADKMLHLRRYVALVIRSQLHSSRYETASRPPQRGGYVFRYLHPGSSRQTYLRPENYVATCNRTYGTTIPQSSQSDVVDHKLTSFCDDVKKGQVSANSLKEVIGLCGKNDYQLPENIGVLLLKCCGNLLPDLEATERDHLASQVWHLVKKNSEGLTLEYYNTLLGVYEENSRPVDPNTFLANMREEPDGNTYRLLFNITAKVGNIQHLWDLLFMIKEKNIAIYEEAINSLVEICATNKNIAEIERAITLMRDTKLPTTKAYTELACGYARSGDIPNLVKILNEEPRDNADLLRIIKVLSMSNNGRHIPVVLNFLMTSVPMIEPQISKMIAELIRVDQTTDAHTIINCLAINNATKDVVQNLVNSFMNELVMLNKPIDNIIRYANDFVDSGCNQQALINIAETGLKLGREKLCFAIFQAMRNRNIEIRPHYYWPLLIRAYHNKGEVEIFSLVKSMVDAGVEIDSDTLLNYVYPYINTANPIVTLHKLLLYNIPGIIASTPLLTFLLQQNRLQDLMPLYTNRIRYKVYYRDLMKPLVRAYLATKDFKNCVMLLTAYPQGHDFVGLFLKSLLKSENPIYIEDVQFLLEELRKCKIKIPQEDATIVKNKLKENRNFYVTTKQLELIDELVDLSIKNSAVTLHPRYMNTKELSCYLVELKSKNANTKNILCRLLIAYCIENNFKKAEEIKREYNTCQYNWLPGMKSVLFELYLKHNKLSEAETLLSDLQTMPGEYQIDKIKTVLYATMLVKADKPTKAFNAIDTINAIDTRGDAQIQCYTLLQTLAQSRYHASTKDMLNLLVRRNYCEITTELFKPLVAIPLEHNDILEAVNVFAECAQKYRKAPLALTILTELLEQKYSSKLHNASNYIEQVYEIIISVYSVEVANTMLAIALATLNKTQKLQSLLQNHELSLNCLVYYINNIKSNRDMDGLWNLFKIADADHLDQNTICESLLSACSKMGDCNRALQLWKMMGTRNIKPSKHFENSFIQFLLSNKIPLPPGIEENRSEINISDQ